ncbi:FxsA family protein [Luedemannella helvata]|uniref:FxsA family protein n=1 Tax=Luedemannella helvata TaxID=349315 RepID=A0ABP4WCB4_9ACTN
MRRALLILFLVVLPVAEIGVIILVGRAIGVPATFLLLLVTTLVGTWLLRREGTRAWRSFRDDLAAGRPPGNAATDGLLVLVGGLLMVLPGFITDAIGLLMVLPPTRGVGRSLVLRLVDRRMSSRARANLFGPRKVRVRYGPAQRNEPPPPPSSTPPPPSSPPPAIEGEIVDPP